MFTLQFIVRLEEAKNVLAVKRTLDLIASAIPAMQTPEAREIHKVICEEDVELNLSANGNSTITGKTREEVLRAFDKCQEHDAYGYEDEVVYEDDDCHIIRVTDQGLSHAVAVAEEMLATGQLF
jgi:hypothetical protein